MLNDRKETTFLVDSVMQPKLRFLCKKYCNSNRYQYKCTIDKSWGCNHPDAQLCEWGNATYYWMLDDLAGENRIESFKKKNGQSLKSYISTILNSNIFFERFKDWRFGKTIRVPDYIRVIDKDACKIFWALSADESIDNISQRLGKSYKQVEKIVELIKLELVKHKKTHLLSAMTKVSIHTDHDESELKMEDQLRLCTDSSPERDLSIDQVHQAFKLLTWQEQFLIESMVMDGLKAKIIINTLIAEDIELIEGQAISKIKEQQIYYLLRKALSHMSELLHK